MKSNKLFRKFGLILCAAMVLSSLASCGEEKSSAVEETEEESSLAEEQQSLESVEDQSTDESQTEQTSDDVSTEETPSDEVESQGEITEEVKALFENVPEEIKNTEGAMAYQKLISQLTDKFTLTFSSVINVDKDTLKLLIGVPAEAVLNAEGEICYDNTGDDPKFYRYTSVKASAEILGKEQGVEVYNERKLTKDGFKYTFNEENKTYTKERASFVPSLLNMLFDWEDVISVETTQEEIDGELYITDVFTMNNGDEYSIVTKNGSLIQYGEKLTDNFTILFSIEVNHDSVEVLFEIPEGYVEE